MTQFSKYVKETMLNYSSVKFEGMNNAFSISERKMDYSSMYSIDILSEVNIDGVDSLLSISMSLYPTSICSCSVKLLGNDFNLNLVNDGLDLIHEIEDYIEYTMCNDEGYLYDNSVYDFYNNLVNACIYLVSYTSYGNEFSGCRHMVA
jgi:hypothetical protein